MNKEQQQIIDEVYNNYLNKVKNYTTEDLFYNALSGVGDIIEGMLSPYTRDFRPYTREEFIDKCKTDPEFSERWGLKIEEKELSSQERKDLYDKTDYVKDIFPTDENGWNKLFDGYKIPTKLITITYKDKTIESYE